MTKQETENLLDALEEWFDVVGPKELEKNETGLNSDRYEKLITKLKGKMYTLAQILEAWAAAYGENMQDEYPGFVQKLSEEKATSLKPQA